MSPLIAAAAVSLLGYHLTFDSEMTTPSDMSQFRNTFSNGDTRLYSNNEDETYVPFSTTQAGLPFNFANGALAVTAFPLDSGGVPYTSGMLETSGIFAQSQGYFEIRAAIPAGQGFWSAFWLLPFQAYYPEIDIIEQPNNTGTDTEYWTHTSTPTDSSGGFSDTGVDLTNGYHRYGFLWTANTIQYVFDGTLVGYPHQTPPSLAGLQMYMIANLAVSNQYGWAGAPLPGTSSAISIDYIRAFSNDPTVPAVSQEPISSPDGANTLPVLTPPTPPTPPTIGLGPDSLVLQVAEDAYMGDAQFTISIDGKQRGPTQTALANHLVGQTQAFTVKGTYGKSRHNVTISYLNDLSGNDGNRNLYVTSATLNGVPVQSAMLNEQFSEPQSFGFCAAVVPPITIGTGPDTFIIGISQDVNIVDAKYVISVDGVVQSGVQVANARHAFGQTQQVAVKGSFGPAAHTIGITFLDGAKVGQPSSGVNLYIDSLSYNGIASPGAARASTNRGTLKLQTPLQQPDTVTLTLAEDSWQGDAQAQITIDGKTQDMPVITAANSAGASQQVTYSGNFGGANVAHTVVVNFLNDSYTGPGQDRNLYVKNITVDSVAINGTTSLMRGGPVTFSYIPPALPTMNASTKGG